MAGTEFNMKHFVLIFSLIISGVSVATTEIDYVLVNKSEKKLYLLSKGDRVKEYNVVFGANPKGHKQQQGDMRTPEGKYILDYKKSDSSFYKAIHISYPNEEDKNRAKASGVNPGGLIMIHGQKNGLSWMSGFTQQFDWTDGCIAVTNAEIDEIWRLVKLGTPIEIRP